ncbi:hypothetical protein BOX15_Mlig007485g2, partial [Macrostomum lignano]
VQTVAMSHNKPSGKSNIKRPRPSSSNSSDVSSSGGSSTRRQQLPELFASLQSISNDLHRLLSSHSQYRPLMDQVGCTNSSAFANWLRDRLATAYPAEQDAPASGEDEQLHPASKKIRVSGENPQAVAAEPVEPNLLSSLFDEDEANNDEALETERTIIIEPTIPAEPRRQIVNRRRTLGANSSLNGGLQFKPVLPAIAECEEQSDDEEVPSILAAAESSSAVEQAAEAEDRDSTDSESCRSTPSPRTLRQIQRSMWPLESPDSEMRRAEAELMLMVDNIRAYDKIMAINRHWRYR